MTSTSASAWDRHGIRAEIARRGATLAQIARGAGLSAGACSLSLIRPAPSADAAIASFLGIPLHELWPDRYDAEGRRLIRPRRRQRPPPPDAA